MNQNVRNWSEKNPDSVRRRSRQRQARVDRWVPSNEIRRSLFYEQGGVCALCGTPIEGFQEGQVEHLTPAVRGGSNEMCNLALAHVSCNREKANKTLGEYIEWRKLVGLPPSSYSSEKLKMALLDGEVRAQAKPPPKPTRRSKEAPVKVSWMPGKEPNREPVSKPDRNKSTKPAQQVEPASSGRRSTVYRYAGNIRSDDLRPVPDSTPAVERDVDNDSQLNEQTRRDTTYRLSRRDLTDGRFKF